VSELHNLQNKHRDYFNRTQNEIAELNGTIQQQRSTISEIRDTAATSNRDNEQEIRSLQAQLSEFNEIKARSFRQEFQIAAFERKISACATLFHNQNEIIECLQREQPTPQE
jgi:predicted RNase H-like nuclease (RuvC/YqgF family)